MHVILTIKQYNSWSPSRNVPHCTYWFKRTLLFIMHIWHNLSVSYVCVATSNGQLLLFLVIVTSRVQSARNKWGRIQIRRDISITFSSYAHRDITDKCPFFFFPTNIYIVYSFNRRLRLHKSISRNFTLKFTVGGGTLAVTDNRTMWVRLDSFGSRSKMPHQEKQRL